MNVGDIVKITDKTNRDLWVSGIVVSLEDEYTWPIVETMLDDKYEVDGDYYDTEVVRAVEPKTIGSIVEYNNKQYIRFRDHEYGWIEVNGDSLTSYRWSSITS